MVCERINSFVRWTNGNHSLSLPSHGCVPDESSIRFLTDKIFNCLGWWVGARIIIRQTNRCVPIRTGRLNIHQWCSWDMTSVSYFWWVWHIFEDPYDTLQFTIGLIRIVRRFFTCHDLLNVFWTTAIVFFNESPCIKRLKAFFLLVLKLCKIQREPRPRVSLPNQRYMLVFTKYRCNLINGLFLKKFTSNVVVNHHTKIFTR